MVVVMLMIVGLVAAMASGGSSASAVSAPAHPAAAVVGTGHPGQAVRTSDATLFSWTPADGLPTGTWPWGQCTWWIVKQGRSGGDHRIHWSGNADQWFANATAAGFPTEPATSPPQPGWIVVFNHGPGADAEVGHVAVVIAATPTSWTVSESNVLGLGVIDQRTFPWPPPAHPEILGWIP